VSDLELFAAALWVLWRRTARTILRCPRTRLAFSVQSQYPSPGASLRALSIQVRRCCAGSKRHPNAPGFARSMSCLAGFRRLSDDVPRTRVRFGLRRYPCATDAGAHEAGVALPRMREAAAGTGPAARGAHAATTRTRSPATVPADKEAPQGRRHPYVPVRET
jgi:hypothetical protein